jgi:hypothetical protein
VTQSTLPETETLTELPDDAEALFDEPPHRKEKVLHTRVPAVLEREIKRFADNLRVPVSNLVRSILEDAIDAADVATSGMEARLKRAAEQLGEGRERLGDKLRVVLAKGALRDVYAFQAVRVARKTSCASCGEPLGAGCDAYLGLSDDARPSARVFVCESCLPRR